jgi:two-component system response regulator HydG
MSGKLLLVEDDEVLSHSLSVSLAQADFDVDVAPTSASAMKLIDERGYDVALVDLGLPDGSGHDVLTRLSSQWPPVPAICLTARSKPDVVVAAMRAGAVDFLTKPVGRQRLLVALSDAMEEHAPQPRRDPAAEQGVVGNSQAWNRAVEHAELVAATPTTTVLLTGERGVGKEVLARLLHRRSHRAKGPFVAINCACLNHSLAESQLFGHEAGAFTGADEQHEGYFEMADGGTLLLDEVGELPLEVQGKLLRVLEQRTFRRVGANDERPFDVRFVFATNRPLVEMRESGRFRADLLDRMSVFEIEIPPLRARQSDISELASYFVERTGEQHGREQLSLSDDALDRLEAYDWPGNVRELRNCIERAAILAREGEILPEHLPEAVRSGSLTGIGVDVGADATLDEIEQKHIGRVFEANDRNVTQSSKVLGVARATLRRKLEKYGIANYGSD